MRISALVDVVLLMKIMLETC